MLHSESTTKNKTQIATENETHVKTPNGNILNAIALIIAILVLAGIISNATVNGRNSKNLDHQLIRELIKERR